MEYIIFLIMKQKTRFENVANIGYRYRPQKAISVDL